MGPSLETALAQGFKYAANHRFPQPQAQPEGRDFILEQAREMLSGTRFWFARLTLVQALCLLSLDSGPARRFANSHDPNYAALVTYRAGLPASVPEHPFVAEARTLAVGALETGQPECFLWIDESTIAATVGPHPGDPHAPNWHQLWIPQSAGWAALHPRAQKLLAEVLVLLNLVERGSPPNDRTQRLRRTNRQDLPPCLTKDWSALASDRTISGARASAPGGNCLDGCEFSLCPYPPRGDTAQIELSEAFCRRQETLMSSNWKARQFWRQMARRARS